MTSRKGLQNLPIRLAAGLYLLDSGLAKIGADEPAFRSMHKMASDAYGLVDQLDSQKFSKFFAMVELTLAVALLLPFVPDVVVGIGLTAFTSPLIGLYFRLPEMRQKGSIRPTPKGTSLAKNIWLMGIGINLALARHRTTEKP